MCWYPCHFLYYFVCCFNHYQHYKICYEKLCKHVFIAALRFVALEHDMIADELLHKKSISALIWLISQGRELEAAYQNEAIFISTDKSKTKYQYG